MSEKRRDACLTSIRKMAIFQYGFGEDLGPMPPPLAGPVNGAIQYGPRRHVTHTMLRT